jgi:hypothetical protein
LRRDGAATRATLDCPDLSLVPAQCRVRHTLERSDIRVTRANQNAGVDLDAVSLVGLGSSAERA